MLQITCLKYTETNVLLLGLVFCSRPQSEVINKQSYFSFRSNQKKNPTKMKDLGIAKEASLIILRRTLLKVLEYLIGEKKLVKSD